jgi:hypothetical protein
MAFSSTISTKEPRAFSFGGPLRAEIHTYSAASADVSGTVTAKNLHTVHHCIIDGLISTTAPVCSGTTAVLAFADPGATVYGTLILIGV